MADGVDYLTGEIITIDGAQWLNHAGNFYEMLKDVTDQEWEQLRNMIKPQMMLIKQKVCLDKRT